jgi:hypothetical protein
LRALPFSETRTHNGSGDHSLMRLHFFFHVISALLFLAAFTSTPIARAADSTNMKTLQPEELVGILAAKSSKPAKPLLLHIGSHIFFVQAHIPGSEYIGQDFNTCVSASPACPRKPSSFSTADAARGTIVQP